MSHSAESDAGRPRPHHFMNADGFCHAGDMFEAGTAWIALYATEALAEVWSEAYHHGVEDMTGTETLDVVRRNPYRDLPPGV